MAFMGTALTYQEYRESRYFAPLDGLRAISALIVVSVHMADNLVHDSWRWLQGEGGVAIFFVLSGYLITTLAIREEQERGRLSLRAFYIRRTLRIFPLYFYVLGITCFLVFNSAGAEGRQQLTAALPYYLTYMSEFAPEAHFYQSWSLGIEEKFYLAWPVLGFTLLRLNPRGRLLIAGAMAAVGLFPGLFPGEIYWADYTRIMAGCLVALSLHEPRLFDKLRVAARGPWLALGLLAFLATHFASPHSRLEPRTWLEPAYTLATCWLLVGLLLTRSWWASFLSTGAMRYLGRRAYAIYLVQLGCIWFVEAFVRKGTGEPIEVLTTYVVACLACVAVADGLFRVVERPGMLIGRKLSDKILQATPSKRPSVRAAALD